MPPACYTSIGVTAKLGEWGGGGEGWAKGPIKWLPVIPSPLTSFKDGEPQMLILRTSATHRQHYQLDAGLG